jgi:hypothetical protein
VLALRHVPNLKGESMKKNLAVLLAVLAAGCASSSYDSGSTPDMVVKDRESIPPMDPKRKVSEQDCSQPVEIADGNLMCRGEPSEAQKRAMREEEERLARARRAAEERAARERAERERAEQAAREAAALKARAAEEARLAALEAERRAKLEEEERQARARKEAEERAERERLERERVEREAREAAERERQRLEQEWLAGRALLERFITTYGKVDKFREVAEPITGFLDKTRQ